MKKWFVIFFLILLPILVHFIPDQYKIHKNITLTSISNMQFTKPAGEIINTFTLTQKLKITNEVIENKKNFEKNAPLCVELFMANYSNRQNAGTFEVSFINGQKKSIKKIQASSVKDNQWHEICFEDFLLQELSYSPSNITIQGINSLPNKAVTVFLAKDQNTEYLDEQNKTNEELIYKLSTKVVDNIVFKSIELNILFLIILIIILIILFDNEIINYNKIKLWFQSDFYSIHITYLLTSIPLLLILTYYIPAFQSPDEHSHFVKSYMVATGQMKIITPSGSSSGGNIDKNLVEYIKINYARNSLSEMEKSKELYFCGDEIFISTGGVQYYAPIIYIPSALVMRGCMWYGLSIEHTYSLMRFFNIIIVTLIGSIALRLLLFGKEFALLILLLPMTLAQTSSTVLDGYIFSLSLLVWALFLYGIDKSKNWNLKLSGITWVTVGILISVRPSFIFFGFLILYVDLYRKHYKGLLIMTIVAFCVLWWSNYAMVNVVDLRQERPISSIELFKNFINQPSIFITPLLNIMTIDRINQYYLEFIGVLGLLNILLPEWLYTMVNLFLIATLILTAFSQNFITRAQKGIVFFVLFASVLIIFFLLWLSWTKIGTPIIEGVQGRYFIPISFGLGLLLSGSLSRYRFSNNIKNFLYKIILLIWICVLYLQLPITLSEYFNKG